MSTKAVVVATLAACFLGCADPIGIERDVEAPLQTDRLRYEMKRVALGYETEIEYTFTNPRDETVFVPNCNGLSEIVIERWTGDAWQHAWGPAIPACLSPVIEIAPGERWTTRLSVFGGDPDCGCGPQFADGIEGTYRLNWLAVLESYDEDQFPFGALVPEEQRVSNRFVLRID